MIWIHQFLRNRHTPNRKSHVCALGAMGENVHKALLEIAKTGSNPNAH